MFTGRVYIQMLLYSGNIVLLGVNNGNLLFSVDRYPYGSIDETRSYSLSGMLLEPLIIQILSTLITVMDISITSYSV